MPSTTGKPSLSSPVLSHVGPTARALADRGPDWMTELRRQGLTRFEGLGLPTTQQEAWKNTSLRALAETQVEPAADPTAGVDFGRLSPLARIDLGTPRLIFVEGRFHAELSRLEGLPEGVWCGSLATALQELPDRLRPHLHVDDATVPEFQALNSALLEDGPAVLVSEGATIEQPIQVLHICGSTAKPTVCHPRTLIVAEANSSVTVVETFSGFDSSVYWTNSVCETVVGDNAQVEHVRLQLESEQAFHISTHTTRQGRDSRLRSHNINLGARLARHNLRSVIDGEGANCTLFGLYLTHGGQHVDNHTTLDHAKPHCDSRELYKGILDDRSRTVFSGRIIVREGAQKTDAKQSNPNLLLSPTALAHTRPQLEIYADDVKCTHGATIGQMDEDAIFYLRSRGIPGEEARRLLIQAFAGEVTQEIELPVLREALESAIQTRLDGAGGA